MGETLTRLNEYIEDLEANTTVSKATVGDLMGMCKLGSQQSCQLWDNYKCPFLEEHIGCLFRQGRVPREW